jgi:hypothetical protein
MYVTQPEAVSANAGKAPKIEQHAMIGIDFNFTMNLHL